MKGRPLLRRLLDLKRSKGADGSKLNRSGMPQVTTALDDGSEGNLFSLGRTLAAKATNELRLRCTEFDGSGNVTLVNGEFKKERTHRQGSFSALNFKLVHCGNLMLNEYMTVWTSSP
jgi:hypothetical protein